MSRLTPSMGLCLVVVLAACERTPVAPTSERPLQSRAAAADATNERIGPGVLEAIRGAGSANIVVALDIPSASSGAGIAVSGLARLRRDVATAQDEALNGIPGTEVGITRRFAAVPAVSATARSEAALHRLAAHPRVRRIDLDIGGTGALGVSVPLIGASQRHALGNDGEGIVVAILDSGLDTDHPDLVDDVLVQACFGDNNNAIDGRGFCPNGSDRQFGPGAAEDDAGHGTHVTGIVTSRGVVSAPGVAPGAGIVALKVTDRCSFSGCFYAFSEIVAALDYIIANNATLRVQVINMSLGTGALFPGACDNSTAFNMAGAAAINTLRGIGVTAFASAGNNGSGTLMTSPACLSNVISVGATDKFDVVAPFSNSNSTTDIFAPGVSILSDARGGGLTIASGTSMASPHAAGCAALLIQAGDATTPAAIEARLKTSPVQVTDPTNNLTFPRIDCSPDGTLPPAPRTCFELAPTGIVGVPGTGPQAGYIVFTGTPGDDVIIGTAGNDFIRGGGGNDRICSLGGNDIVFGGDGNDRIHGGDGNDMIEGQSGNDLIEGGNGNDRVEGNAGDDDVQGNGGDDLVFGNAGTDVNDGGPGTDTCYDPQGATSLRCETIVAINFP